MRKYNVIWFAFLVYVCLLLVPNFLPLGHEPLTPMRHLESVERMCYGACAWVLWFAVFGGRLWLGVALSVPLALVWLPAEFYLRLQVGSTVTAAFVGLLVETNRREAVDFLSVYWVWVFVAGILPIIAGVWLVLLCRRYELRWSHRSRIWVLLLLPSLGMMVYWAFDQQQDALDSGLQGKSDVFWVRPLGYWVSKWGAIFPLDPYFAGSRYVSDLARVKALRASIQGFKFGASRAEPTGADLLVLVIGESARVDRWQFGGYTRTTNPLLSRQGNLIFMSDVVTFSTATRTAVPAIISRRPVVNALGAPGKYVEPSFLKALSEVGYSTYWISNQSASGFFDTSVAFYARDADSVEFVNPGNFGVEGSYDLSLLAGLRQAVATGRRAAIVLHTLGSHFNYAHRYPVSFDHFRPSIKQKQFAYDPEMVRKLEVNNAYDNSILYTDYVLSEVIDAVKASGRSAAVLYVSDHGEDIYEPGCVSGGVVRNSEASFRVPAFIWYSDRLAQVMPSLVQAIKDVSRKPLQTDFVFPAMMRLAGVTVPPAQEASTPPTDAFLERSPHARRLVAGAAGGVVDFDEAVRRDRCSINAPK